MKELYITITHVDLYCGIENIKTGDRITIKKEPENRYDDEAIAAYCQHDLKCGYVANSVRTVSRGTYSAGRLYDKFDETMECVVMFMIGDTVIARIDDNNYVVSE